MKALKCIPNKYFNLAVVDPPYGIGQSGGKNKSRGKFAVPTDYKPFAGNDMNPMDKTYFNELERVSENQIIFGANHFADRLPHCSSPCWIIWDKFKWQGMLQGNMANKEIRIHPTQKPVALYRWIFQHYAKPGDKILDTHLGSGSSRIAAYEAGLDFIGFEIDKYYFDKQEERFVDYTSQISLFNVGESI